MHRQEHNARATTKMHKGHSANKKQHTRTMAAHGAHTTDATENTDVITYAAKLTTPYAPRAQTVQIQRSQNVT